MQIQIEEREKAKVALREALAAAGGNTKDKIVLEAIEKLASFNPTTNPARSSLSQGNWLLINAPNFPGGELRSDGKYQYTLGRLAFNMFEPVELKIVIDRVSQPILPLPGEEEKYTYNIVVDFTVLDEKAPKLQGIVRNLGVCYPSDDRTLKVKFTGGELLPPDTVEMNDWLTVFGNQNKSTKLSIADKLKSFFLKVMFGLKLPEAIDKETGKVSFAMTKSPQGSLKLIYLDEELRITRGNRETIVICERVD